VSRRTEGKNARRKKRRAARDARWIAGPVLEELMAVQAELAAELEVFDERITQRGWIFDEELSEDGFAAWLYEPSGAQVPEQRMETVTRVVASEGDTSDLPDGAPPFPDAVSVFLVGDNGILNFTPDELFDHLDVIEAYRFGDPPPQF
jgi:hypothetical protein